jgi:ElaB/YqjD/DUF883 family membrane-anchored ribosome-binding protein
MNLKSAVESISEEVTGQVEHLPERANRARQVARRVSKDVASRAAVLVREHPGRALVGAFLIGFAIAKVAKRA